MRYNNKLISFQNTINLREKKRGNSFTLKLTSENIRKQREDESIHDVFGTSSRILYRKKKKKRRNVEDKTMRRSERVNTAMSDDG